MSSRFGIAERIIYESPPQLTVSVSTTLRLIAPLVAVTVNVLVPAGVPGLLGGGGGGATEPPAPHPAITKTKVNAVKHAIAVIRLRERLTLRAIAIITTSKTISQIIRLANGPNSRVPSTFSSGDDDAAVVVTLTATFAVAVPETFTFAGTPQFASEGAPLHDNVKFPLNPLIGVSASEYVAVCPGLTIAVAVPFAAAKITFGVLPLDAAHCCANFIASTDPNPLAAS
jgi:hypothetical protein